MELVKQTIWMVIRIRRVGFGMASAEAIHAYHTKEEADKKLKEYAGCMGEFEVTSTETWFPPFN